MRSDIHDLQLGVQLGPTQWAADQKDTPMMHDLGLISETGSSMKSAAAGAIRDVMPDPRSAHCSGRNGARRTCFQL